MKHLLLDAANTLIYKPLLWDKILDILDNHGYKIQKEELIQKHKLLSELITFPDRTSKDFYANFNSELLMSIGIIPDEVIVAELFASCSYLPWTLFEDCKYLLKLNVEKTVVSNFNGKLQDTIESLAGTTLISNYIISENENFRKPNLEFYELVLEKLNANPSEVIYVGDSIKLDIIPSSKLGIKSYLIDRDNIYPSFKNRITSFADLKNIC